MGHEVQAGQTQSSLDVPRTWDRLRTQSTKGITTKSSTRQSSYVANPAR